MRPTSLRGKGKPLPNSSRSRALHRIVRAVAMPTSSGNSTAAAADIKPSPVAQEQPASQPSNIYKAELQSGTFFARPPPLGKDPMILESNPDYNRPPSTKQDTESSTEALTMRDIVRGGGQVGDNVRPRFFSPLVQPSTTRSRMDRSKLPLMLYLPGIDGLGLAASRQFTRLQQAYDLRAMFIPVENRDNFPSLVKYVEEYLAHELEHSDPSRPVYLLGESFGGILALQCALDFGPEKVHRVILVNPATSFVNAPWAQLGPILTNLPPEAYKNLPFFLAPILSNPVGLASYAFRRPSSSNPLLPPSPFEVIDSVNKLVQGLLQLLPSLGSLADILPPQTLAWKLKLLQEGCDAVNPNLGKVQQRTLALFSDLDLLIPSLEESRRYKREFPRARVDVQAGRGHALLQEGGVDLLDLINKSGFYQSKRVMSAPLDFTPNVKGRKSKRARATTTPPPSTLEAEYAKQEKEVVERVTASPASSSASASPAATAASVPFKVRPVDLPTRKELELQSQDNSITLFRRATSPVFFSKDEAGRIVRGLGNVPTDRRPILLIGNHQTWAPDLGLIITEFLEEKSTLPRGLAHPAIFTSFQGSGEDAGKEAKEKKNQTPSLFPALNALILGLGTPEGRNNAGRGAGGAGSIGGLFSQFGAVPVSSKNFYRLLENGETILLFPGGVREAYKRRNEKYQLFWPSQSEFVRMCARFGATLVPFAAVGAEDGVEILADSEQLKNLPILGERVRQGTKNVPRARRGASADKYSEFGEEAEDFIAPLIAPKGAPERYYFLFQSPITLTGNETKEECDKIYAKCKSEVESGLEWLQTKRKADPFREFAPRLVYEAPSGFQRQAPTFRLD